MIQAYNQRKIVWLQWFLVRFRSNVIICGLSVLMFVFVLFFYRTTELLGLNGHSEFQICVALGLMQGLTIFFRKKSFTKNFCRIEQRLDQPILWDIFVRVFPDKKRRPALYLTKPHEVQVAALIHAPFTRGDIIVSSEAVRLLSEAELEAAILHEKAHMLNNDMLVKILNRNLIFGLGLVGALLWIEGVGFAAVALFTGAKVMTLAIGKPILWGALMYTSASLMCRIFLRRIMYEQEYQADAAALRHTGSDELVVSLLVRGSEVNTIFGMIHPKASLVELDREDGMDHPSVYKRVMALRQLQKRIFKG